MSKIYLKAEYRTKPDKAEFVANCAREFVAAINAHEPDTFYVAYQEEDDPRSFTHFMSFADEAAERSHKQADYTNKFVAAIYPECEQEPVFTPFKLVAETKKGSD